jgi:hypothetical protein|nr:MAG TPA: hypothetical protein [Crassvirales sp.]
MAEYGLQVNGAPPTDGLAMLVDVVQTPVNIGAPEGRYLFPEMTDKQKERFYHYFSAVDSAVMYGKTALQTGGAGKVAVVSLLPIFTQDEIDKVKKEGGRINSLKDRLDELLREHKIIGFSWKTIEIDYYRAYNSCQAVMVWRGVK